MPHSHPLGDLPSELMTKDGSRNFEAGIRVQHPDAPLNDADIANKAYVDGVAGAGNTQLQGEDVATATPNEGDALVYSDGAWRPTPFLGSGVGVRALPPGDEWEASGVTPWPTLGNANVPDQPYFEVTHASGSVTTSGMKRTVVLPDDFVPGEVLAIRVRFWIDALAQVSTDVQCQVNLSRGLGPDADSTDLGTPLLLPITASSVWADYLFVIDTTDLLGGTAIVLNVRLDTDDTAGSQAVQGRLGSAYLVRGTPAQGFIIGHSLIGSTKVRSA